MAARRPRPLWPLAAALFLALLLLGPQAADAQDAATKKKKKKKKKPAAGADVFGSFDGQPAQPAQPAPAPDSVPPPPTAMATDIPKILMDAVDAAVPVDAADQYTHSTSTQPSFPNLGQLVCDFCPDFEPPSSGSGSPLERVQEWFERLEEFIDPLVYLSGEVFLLALATQEWVEGA